MPLGNAAQKGGSRAAAAGIKRVPASVQLLDTRLQSYDAEVREQGWKSILTLGAPEEPLIDKCEELLHVQNWFVREAGCQALGHCVDVGSGMAAVAAAEQHLETDEHFLRYCACQTLLSIEERSNKMVAELRQQQSYNNQMANPPAGRAEELIKKIDKASAPAEKAVEMLAQRLTHADPKVRKSALYHLSLTDWRCVPHAQTICAMVTDANVSVRYEVLRVLNRLGLHMVEGIPLIAAALGHEASNMRIHAHKTLVQMSHLMGAEVATAVLVPLESEERVTRIAALELFAELGALQGPHGKDIAKHLEELDPEVRMCTVRTLIAAGRAMQSSANDIKKKTKHENPDICRAAIETLRGLGPTCPKVPKMAHRDLEEDPTLRDRIIALEILAGAGHNINGFLEEMVKCLEDKDWDLRRRAIESLADLEEHAEPAAPEVAKRILHHDPDVRRAAAEALGRMGLHSGEYGHRVEGLLDTEEDQDVKNTCAMACELLYAVGMSHGR